MILYYSVLEVACVQFDLLTPYTQYLLVSENVTDPYMRSLDQHRKEKGVSTSGNSRLPIPWIRCPGWVGLSVFSNSALYSLPGAQERVPSDPSSFSLRPTTASLTALAVSQCLQEVHRHLKEHQPSKSGTYFCSAQRV